MLPFVAAHFFLFMPGHCRADGQCRFVCIGPDVEWAVPAAVLRRGLAMTDGRWSDDEGVFGSFTGSMKRPDTQQEPSEIAPSDVGARLHSKAKDMQARKIEAQATADAEARRQAQPALAHCFAILSRNGFKALAHGFHSLGSHLVELADPLAQLFLFIGCHVLDPFDCLAKVGEAGWLHF